MAARAQTERVGMARNAVVCETAAQTLALAFLRLLVFSAAAGMEAEGIVGWAVAGRLVWPCPWQQPAWM